MRTSSVQIQAMGDCILDLLIDSYKTKPKRGYWSFSFQDIERIFTTVRIEMPRAKKDNPAPKVGTAAKTTVVTEWVNVRLSPEQIQEVLHLAENPDEIGKALASLLVQDFGFSVRSNVDRQNFSAFITGITANGNSTLYAVSGFAPSALAASASVLIKFYAIADDPTLLDKAQSAIGIG